MGELVQETTRIREHVERSVRNIIVWTVETGVGANLGAAIYGTYIWKVTSIRKRLGGWRLGTHRQPSSTDMSY